MKMKVSVFFLSLVFLFNGCASITLLRYEDGEILVSRQDLRRTSEPEKYEVSLEKAGSVSNPILKVKARKNEPQREEWVDVYSRMAVFSAPDTYSFRTGRVEHSSVEIKEPVEGTTTRRESIVKDVWSPIDAKSLKVTINNKSVSSDLAEGVAQFQFKDLHLEEENLPRDAKMFVSFVDQHLDVSVEFAALVENENKERLALQEARNKEIADRKSEKYRNACESGNCRACSKMSLRWSGYNFGTYLYPPHIANVALAGDKLQAGILYVSKPMRLIQRIATGYLITNHEETGIAFVMTDKILNPNVQVCFVLLYAGNYSYTGIDGFEKQVPRMCIYKGPHPPTTCDEFPQFGTNAD